MFPNLEPFGFHGEKLEMEPLPGITGQGLAGKSNSILKHLLYQFNGLGRIMLYPSLIDSPAPDDPQIRCSGWWVFHSVENNNPN